MEPAPPLRQWIGRQEQATDLVTPTPYAALAATLDQDSVRPGPGVPLPPLWHWLYFLPLYQRSEIGHDGHAKRGAFLPPVPLPRRMWAGSQLEFHHSIHIGDTLNRTSTIESVDEKAGRSGPLVFVKVRHDIRIAQTDVLALTEFHDIVYREAARVDDPVPPAQPAPEHAAWEKDWVPDDVLLFRYSALTFNGHRIHYDRRYVTEVEGYPGLIVHGPLIATLLVDLLRDRAPHARLSRFTLRAVRPLFDVHGFRVCGEPLAQSKTVHLWAQDHQHWLAMDATAVVE